MAADAVPMITSDAGVSILIDGRTIGPCRQLTDGEVGGDGLFIRPGAMGPGIARAAPKGYETVTLEYGLTHAVDSGLEAWVKDRHGFRVVITKQAKDQRGQAGFHAPNTTSGVLVGIKGFDYEADGTDPATLRLTVQPDSSS